MAEPFTSYIVDNDRKFRAAIQRAADAVSDLTIPFTLIQSDFYRSEAAIFQLKSAGQYPDFKTDSQGRSRYAERKLKEVGFKYPLLVKTGRLAQSLLGPNSPDSIASIGPTQLIIGTRVPYGVYPQSDQPRRVQPQRKFLFIGPEAPQFASSDQAGRPERWINILNDYVLKKTKSVGFGS